MPAQKRLPENTAQDLTHSNNDGTNQDQLQPETEGSDRSPNGSGPETEEGFIMVKLSEVRKEVQCPICLGIIRKTRTVMECLHRFCRECIDKSMRLGNKECPACRTHCASRRSLRDDPNYDSLIAALYPNIDQYEVEELAFHDEENARNKQIQASIAQTIRRQSEALSKKKKRPRSMLRRRSNNRPEDDGATYNNTPSPDERSETRIKRPRRSRGRPSSPATDNEEGANEENDAEANRDSGLLFNSFVGTSEMLAWGKGGMRSHTRYGSGGGCNGKYVRTNRLARLVDHLRNMKEDDELDIHIVFIALEGDKTPSLPQSHLCCRPALSIKQLCEFIAGQTSLQADEVEILAVKELHSKINFLASLDVQLPNSSLIDACKDDLQVLNFEQTLGCVKSAYNLTQGHMILAYRQKLPAQGIPAPS